MMTLILILVLCALITLLVFAPLWRRQQEDESADGGQLSREPQIVALEQERNRFVEELRGLDIALAERKLDPHDHASERARLVTAAEKTVQRLRQARANGAKGRHGRKLPPATAIMAGVLVTVLTVGLAYHFNGLDLRQNVSPHASGQIPIPAQPGAAEDSIAAADATGAGGAPVLDENGQPDIAAMVDRLEKRVAEGNPSMQDLAMLARSYGVLGRTAEAIDIYRQALAKEPENVDLMMALGMALFDSDDKQTRAEAAPIFDRILALQPDKPEALWFKSLGLVENHKIKDARVILVRLAGLVTENPAAEKAVSTLLKALDADVGPAPGGVSPH